MHLIVNYSHMAQNRGNVSDIRASMYEFKYINNHCLVSIKMDGYLFHLIIFCFFLTSKEIFGESKIMCAILFAYLISLFEHCFNFIFKRMGVVNKNISILLDSL